MFMLIATLNERPFHETRLTKYSEDIMQVKLLVLVSMRVDGWRDQSKVLPQEGRDVGLRSKDCFVVHLQILLNEVPGVLGALSPLLKSYVGLPKP